MTVPQGEVSVSVIVPSYNYAQYLSQRMRTILDQTYENFEAIVIDDASADDSASMIDNFARDPRVKPIYCTVNSGSVYQRWNEAAALARGRYLWFAGADDYCEPTLLEELVRSMETQPSIGIAFTQTWIVAENGRRLFLAPTWSHSCRKEGTHARQVLLLDTTIANASGVLLRTDVFREVGGFDLSFRLAADWKLYLDVLLGSDLAYVAKPLNYCRTHSATVSVQARRSGAEAQERYRLIHDLCFRCPDLRPLRETALDREAERCLINAANCVRKGSVRPALRILAAGAAADSRHTRRMLKHIPHLSAAIKAKLFAARRDMGRRPTADLT